MSIALTPSGEPLLAPGEPYNVLLDSCFGRYIQLRSWQIGPGQLDLGAWVFWLRSHLLHDNFDPQLCEAVYDNFNPQLCEAVHDNFDMIT